MFRVLFQNFLSLVTLSSVSSSDNPPTIRSAIYTHTSSSVKPNDFYSPSYPRYFMLELRLPRSLSSVCVQGISTVSFLIRVLFATICQDILIAYTLCTQNVFLQYHISVAASLLFLCGHIVQHFAIRADCYDIAIQQPCLCNEMFLILSTVFRKDFSVPSSVNGWQCFI